MAKTRKKSGASKTEAIRDALTKSPGASPKDIAQTLKGRGVNVTAAYVSTIKSNLKRRESGKTSSRGPSARTRSTRTATANGSVSVDSLMNAKSLIDSAGSPEKARQALEVVSKLS